MQIPFFPVASLLEYFFSFVLYLCSRSAVFVALFALYLLLPSKKDMSGRTVADSFVLLCVNLGGGDPSLPPISQIAPQIILLQTYFPFKHISLLQQNVSSAFKM